MKNIRLIIIILTVCISVVMMVYFTGEYRSKLSYNLVQKGYNYYKVEDYSNAKIYTKLATLLYPSSAVAHFNLGRVYLATGDTQDAIDANLNAIELDNNYKYSHYELGRIYFQYERDYKIAITHYKNAIRIAPRNESYQHALARAYQEDGDVENAITHFQLYLKYAKKGANTHFVRQYLESVGVVAEGAETDTNYLLRQGNYEALESLLSKVLYEREKNEFGYYTKFTELTDKITNIHVPLDLLEDWLDKKPDSHFAHYCLGEYYINQAWHARGSGWSSTVVNKGRDKFTADLKKSARHLKQAINISSANPIAAAAMIQACKGLGCNKSIVEDYFAIAQKADFEAMPAYRKKLDFYYPKWRGDKNFVQARRFVSEVTENASETSRVWWLVVLLHKEITQRVQSDKKVAYFKHPEVWSELYRALENLQSTFPDSHRFTLELAYYANMTDNVTVLNEQLEIIDGIPALKQKWEKMVKI